jgi:hypothetical protein
MQWSIVQILLASLILIWHCYRSYTHNQEYLLFYRGGMTSVWFVMIPTLILLTSLVKSWKGTEPFQVRSLSRALTHDLYVYCYL